MTRRLALLALGALAQTATPQALRWSEPTAPARLTIDLNNWSDWTVTHHGESVTVTSAEIFAALMEKRA